MNKVTADPLNRLVQQIATGAAIFGLCALALQFYLTTSRAVTEGKGFLLGIVQYVGFFTILTNWYVTLIFIAHARAGSPSKFWQFLRRPQNLTSAVASIMVVWSVYHFVLLTPPGPQGLNYWADWALHYVIPFGSVIFWWLAIPRGQIDLGKSSWGYLIWYPLFYLIYVFVRGAIMNSYPYFFINVTNIGYARAFINSGGIMVLLIGLILLFWLINRIAGRKINR